MKPGVPRWATNANYAGGPGIGQPTKMPPSPGQEEDGIEPDAKVDAQIWNYKRWESDEKLDAIEYMRVKTWIEATIAGSPDIVCDVAAWDPFSKRHTILGLDGGTSTLREIYSDRGGRYWVQIGVGGSLSIANFTDLAVDNADVRTAIQTGAGDIHYSTSLGAYAQWAGPPAFTASKIGHDWIGLWVTNDTATKDLYRSTGSGVGFVSTFTGFTAGGPAIRRIGHSHHPAGTLYPDDSGNQFWFSSSQTVVVGNSEFATSADGITWALVASPTIGTVLDTAYGWYGSRLISPCSDITGGLGRILISDDNGASWVASNILPYRTITTAARARIATDGYGTWVVMVSQLAGTLYYEMFCSVDNGDTWSEIFVPQPGIQTANQILPVVWYGEGIFGQGVQDTSIPNIHHSLVAID